MAEVKVEIGVKWAWWVRPAMYLAWPISWFSEWKAECYLNWIAAKGLTAYVR